MKFITDEEINLNLEDSLQTKKYVKTLKDVIESSESKYTIGLFGEWGTGKSSIVKTVQEELEQEKPNDIKFIVYDAWKYSGDSFRRMFIKTLSDKLGFNLAEEIDNFYYDRTEEIEERKFDWKNIFKNISIFLILSLTLYIVLYLILGDDIFKTDNIGLVAIIPIIISSIGIFLNNAYKSQKKVVQYNKFFAPEQFENLTNELLSKSLRKYPIIELVKEYIKGNNHCKNLEKIVVVIDNIDRCDGETSYQLLTNIKNFLANKEGVVFLIPIDDEALKRHLSIEDKNKSKEADEFLRKFFNVSLKIKYFQPTDLFQFTNDLNNKYNLSLNPNTIDIISKEYATNPRRIIQMLNNLTTELNLIKNKTSEDFVNKNESLISILLIIREEWTNLYKKIVKEPHILKNMTFSDSELDEKKFFKKAKTIIEKSEILSIEKIVLNIDNKSLLAQEIIDNLENEDYESIKVSIDNHTVKFDVICDYIIKELETEITRETYDTSVINTFLNILNINKIEPLKENHLFQIKNTIEDKLEDILKNVQEENYGLLFDFVKYNKKENLLYLFIYFKQEFNKTWSDEDVLSAVFKDEISDKDDVVINGFSYLLKILDVTDIDTTIKKIFQKFYLYHNKEENFLLKNETLSIDILNKLEFDSICTYLIEKLDFTFVIDNNQPNINDYINGDYEDLKFIMDSRLVSLENIEPIFEKFKLDFNTLHFPIAAENVKSSLTEIISNFIEDITQSIENLKTKKYDSSYVKTFISNLKSNQLYYFNGARNSDNYLYQNEITRDIEFQKTLLKFYLAIYRSTYNETDVKTNILELIRIYPNIKNEFYEGLLRISSIENISFVRVFKEKIYEDKEYENDLLLELLKELFLDKKKVNKEVINKIRDILEYLLSSEENEKQYAFIEELLIDSDIKGFVSNEILEFEFEKILLFNSSIRRLAYDDFVEKNKVFELENSVLIDMIKTNEEKYKDEIIKVIKTYLPDKSKIDKGFELLDTLTMLNDEEKAYFIKELSEHKKDKDLAKQVEDYCKKLES